MSNFNATPLRYCRDNRLFQPRTISVIILGIITVPLVIVCLFRVGHGAFEIFSPTPSAEQLRNHTQELVRYDCADCGQLNTTVMTGLSRQLQSMYKPLIDGEGLSATRAPLGAEMCIVDIDTRSYDHDGQMLSDTFNWDDTDPLSAGMLNHYIYAAMHGYTHHIIRSQPWPGRDRDDVWTKVPIILKLLDSCKVLLAVDSDVVIQKLDLSFEWLLDHWNITTTTPLALPWDTKRWVPAYDLNVRHQRTNLDIRGNYQLNAGVIVAQDLPETRQVLQAWIDCPDSIEGCDRYRHGWPAEQGAFNNHIRYLWPNSFTTIPCDDANGYPEQPSECGGQYLRHFTSAKDMTRDNVAHVSLYAMAKLFTTHRLAKQDVQ